MNKRPAHNQIRLWAVAFWLLVWQIAAMALDALYPQGHLLLQKEKRKMLFWLFVIIAVISVGVLILSERESTVEKEYARLEAEYRSADRRYDYSWGEGAAARIELYNQREAAKVAMKTYEEEHRVSNRKANKEILFNIGMGFLIGALVIVIIMLMVIGITELCAPATRAQLEAEYEVLSWEVENDVYAADDDVVGRKELYNHVREWNKALAVKQAGEKNFWYGIFVPNIYGDLQTIELN